MPALAIWAVIQRIGGSALAFLGKLNVYQLGCIALALFATAQTLRLGAEQRKLARAVQTISQISSARAADRQSYAKAQADAQAANKAQVERIKQQQQEITDATVSRLNSRLELIRSELRKPQAPAPQSHPVSPATGDASEAPCRVIDPAWMCLSPADRLRAAENEERHDELIDWNLQQSAIDPNK